MKKRGQTSSMDFIIGVVIFISVLSVFLFYFAPKTFFDRGVPYSVVQSAWFNLEKQGFVNGYLFNSSVVGSLDYDVVKEKIIKASGNVYDVDFCFYSVGGPSVFHFGPGDDSIDISRSGFCGDDVVVLGARPTCKGLFNSGRSISKPAFDVVVNEFVRLNLLVCAEVRK